MVEKWSWGAGGSPVLLESTVYGIGLDPISQLVVGQGEAVFVADGHSGVRQAAEAGGAVLLVKRYDAFGGVVQAAGTFVTDVGYRGERTDGLTGDLYLRARTYDPASGRFRSMDPYGGNYGDYLQAMRYGYAGGNPVWGMDPSGLFSASSTLVGISVSSQLRGTYNESVLEVGAQIGVFLLGNIFLDLAFTLIPPDVKAYLKLNFDQQSAWVVGAQGGYTFERSVFGLGVEFGLEFVGSLRTSNWAAYSFLGSHLEFGNTGFIGVSRREFGRGIIGSPDAIQVYAGAVYNMSNAGSYAGDSASITLPAGYLLRRLGLNENVLSYGGTAIRAAISGLYGLPHKTPLSSGWEAITNRLRSSVVSRSTFLDIATATIFWNPVTTATFGMHLDMNFGKKLGDASFSGVSIGRQIYSGLFGSEGWFNENAPF